MHLFDGHCRPAPASEVHGGVGAAPQLAHALQLRRRDELELGQLQHLRRALVRSSSLGARAGRLWGRSAGAHGLYAKQHCALQGGVARQGRQRQVHVQPELLSPTLCAGGLWRRLHRCQTRSDGDGHHGRGRGGLRDRGSGRYRRERVELSRRCGGLSLQVHRRPWRAKLVFRDANRHLAGAEVASQLLGGGRRGGEHGVDLVQALLRRVEAVDAAARALDGAHPDLVGVRVGRLERGAQDGGRWRRRNQRPSVLRPELGG
mmetsp:Transcript_1171/g.2435  ORF Transcript_1171/g.2435 Transcript_1171/m.2435 type:complete len:261 (-) Transcript_1171:854-1636(-)